MKLNDFDASAAYFPDLCFKKPPDLGIMLGSGWGEALKTDEIVFRVRGPSGFRAGLSAPQFGAQHMPPCLLVELSKPKANNSMRLHQFS